MTGDRYEADRILGEDGIDPGYRRYREAWNRHPQREPADAQAVIDEHDDTAWPKP